MKAIHTKNGKTLYKDDNGRWLSKGSDVRDPNKEDQIAKAKAEADRLNGERNEEVKGLIFGNARITPTFTDIDGYSNKKTEKSMLRELSRAVRRYSKSEASVLEDMVKFNELSQAPYDGGGYILEWEAVPGAGRFDNDDNYESADAKWYVHIRFNH